MVAHPLKGKRFVAWWRLVWRLVWPAAATAFALVVLLGESGCARGCTRMVSLTAQRAASEYISQSVRIPAPARVRELAFAPSLRKLRAVGDGNENGWRTLGAMDRNLAFAGLVGLHRSDADDALLAKLVTHGVDPFQPDLLGRVPFAIAAGYDHIALKMLLPHLATARGLPSDQIMCGLHQFGGRDAARIFRGYCRCQ